MATVPRYLPSGEAALTVEFGQAIDPAINAKVQALDIALQAAAIAGIIESVPTYRSLLIHFDPKLLTTEQVIAQIEALEAAPLPTRAPNHWIIPACYEGAHAEDLAEVAAALHLSEADVVRLHASTTFQVYMYGFAPGWLFLGGLPHELAISRRPAPRPPVPRGALLIAGGQALIGHDPMPTGWYLIGCTPLPMFDATRDPPCFIAVGDHVQFEAIDPATFASLERGATEGIEIARRAPSPDRV